MPISARPRRGGSTGWSIVGATIGAESGVTVTIAIGSDSFPPSTGAAGAGSPRPGATCVGSSSVAMTSGD